MCNTVSIDMFLPPPPHTPSDFVKEAWDARRASNIRKEEHSQIYQYEVLVVNTYQLLSIK